MSEHEQTAALRLADNLENLEATGSGGDYFVLTEWSQRRALEAASELRRLDAENKAFMNLLRRAQPAQAGQWLPIETAPKDWGVTEFDVWANDARFADCWWGKATYEQGEPGIVYQSDYDCNGPVDSYVRNATHWMPIPPPPSIVAP